MSKIVQIKPNTNIPDSLRQIADDYDDGSAVGKSCTLILGVDIFHLGTFDDADAAVLAIWDMTYGIHKLMKKALAEDD